MDTLDAIKQMLSSVADAMGYDLLLRRDGHEIRIDPIRRDGHA